MAAVRIAAVLAAVTRLVDRRQLADSAASADHQSVGCLSGQKPPVETPQSHDARVVFHPGEDQRLRIVVRRVHGGARKVRVNLRRRVRDQDMMLVLTEMERAILTMRLGPAGERLSGGGWFSRRPWCRLRWSAVQRGGLGAAPERAMFGVWRGGGGLAGPQRARSCRSSQTRP